MSEIQARFLSIKKEYRCGLFDCDSLLCKGEIIKGEVEIKCKCGVTNSIEPRSAIAEVVINRPERKNGMLKGSSRSKK